MRKILPNLLDCIVSNFRSRAALQFEIIALRHQLEVLQRTRPTRVRLTRLDRIFWVFLYRLWPRCLDAVVIVKPETVIAWHRKGFRAFWAWKSRPRRRGRPPVPAEVRTLIRRMTRENPLWGAPRLHGELLKLGIVISQATVSKYMIRHPKPPSQTWRTFLRNHVGCLASVDFFVVSTATFRLLFVFIVLHHERRRIVHFGVTAHPTSLWVSQQIREAFPWETAPRYLIHDRDGVPSSDRGFRPWGSTRFSPLPDPLGRTRTRNVASERSGINASTTSSSCVKGTCAGSCHRISTITIDP